MPVVYDVPGYVAGVTDEGTSTSTVDVPSMPGFLAGLQLEGSAGTWKTTEGLAKASVKTVLGLARASIKTFQGLTP